MNILNISYDNLETKQYRELPVEKTATPEEGKYNRTPPCASKVGTIAIIALFVFALTAFPKVSAGTNAFIICVGKCKDAGIGPIKCAAACAFNLFF